jgi:hypothetical protein
VQARGLGGQLYICATSFSCDPDFVLEVRTHTTEVCLVVQQLATNRQLPLKVLAFIIVRKSSSSLVAGLRGAGLIVVTEKCENNSEIDSGEGFLRDRTPQMLRADPLG